MDDKLWQSRRGLLQAAATGGLALSAAGLFTPTMAAEEEEVGATEDLMREHGVLRRTLIVYSEAAALLLNRPQSLDPKALADAAELFREFGEEYHERYLEEQFVFPRLKQAGGDAAQDVDTLITQHRRGREITQFIATTAKQGRIGSESAGALANALTSFVRMYRAHAAREDTVIFPAWKKVEGDHVKELAEEFEEIEHKQFGEDGFDKAVERITRIEQTLGLAALAGFTAPSPPANR